MYWEKGQKLYIRTKKESKKISKKELIFKHKRGLLCYTSFSENCAPYNASILGILYQNRFINKSFRKNLIKILKTLNLGVP